MTHRLLSLFLSFSPLGHAAQSFSFSSEIRAVGEQGRRMSPEVWRKRVRTGGAGGTGGKVVDELDDDDNVDVIASLFPSDFFQKKALFSLAPCSLSLWLSGAGKAGADDDAASLERGEAAAGRERNEREPPTERERVEGKRASDSTERAARSLARPLRHFQKHRG